jgi:2-hydroxychromene-2-carboxylate isomerase
MAHAPVEFLFDYASPWSYLANASLARHFDPAAVTFVPIYLRGLESFRNGLPYSPAKLAYIFKDFVRCAAQLEVPVTMPPVFPVNGLYALRGALAAQRDGAFDAYHAAMFRAAWKEGRDVSSREVVAAVAREAGAPGAAAALDDPDIKEALRATTDRAIARGAFGVPTFFVGEEMYWGHDRMHLAAAEARRGGSTPSR